MLWRKFRVVGVTVLASIAAAVVYGLIHDQITIRICPEYFTVWHPHLIDYPNLTVLALFWGVVATWWMGAILGFILGFAAVLGPKPPPAFPAIVRSLVFVLLFTAGCAIVVGVGTAVSGFIAPAWISGLAISSMGQEELRRFTIDLFIHNASYDISSLATIFAAWRLYKRR